MHRSKTNGQTSTGFTLIELLVVIAIIAILAAILFPVFAQAREKARTASCQSNCKQLGLAILMYVQDYDEQMPFGGWRPGGGPDGVGTWDWQNSTAPYIKSAAVFQCPSSTDLVIENGDPTFEDWDVNPVSYLYNNQMAANRNELSSPRWLPRLISGCSWMVMTTGVAMRVAMMAAAALVVTSNSLTGWADPRPPGVWKIPHGA